MSAEIVGKVGANGREIAVLIDYSQQRPVRVEGCAMTAYEAQACAQAIREHRDVTIHNQLHVLCTANSTSLRPGARNRHSGPTLRWQTESLELADLLEQAAAVLA